MPSNHNLLQQLFGFSAFREGQKEAVDSLLSGHSTLAIFPTGSGKSLCYQFVATQLPHLTLVVSPLLALMKDQLEFLHSKGIAAASIDSTLTPEQNKQVMNDVRSGQCKILMVSVERFKNERFRQFIESVQVSMLVVDEAHCISEWGHNFRPDYLKLPAYQKELNIPLVLLLTATATKKVKEDMAARFAIAPTSIIQTGFYRPNLNLFVRPVLEPNKNQALIDEIQKQQGAGIVYVTLQKSAEEVAQFLQQQGFDAKAYHAGLDSNVRQGIQQDFMHNKLQVVVATIAFGMGIDKSDIRFVIHYDLPKSIENYSQEIGRGGRDGKAANCTVLANLDGLVTIENFVYGDTPDESAIQRVIDDIKSQAPDEKNSAVQNDRSIHGDSNLFQWETQINSLSGASNIRQLPLKTLLVQLELANVIRPLYAYFAEYKFRFISDKAAILSMFSEERARFLDAVFTHSNMKKVWGVVDFDSIYQHYGAERSRVVAALEYLHEHNHIELASRLITDVYRVNNELLQDGDLANKLAHYFSENERKEVERIAALVSFFEQDTCLSHNLSAYFDDTQAPKACGHCSVCQGKVAKLSYSSPISKPDSEKVLEAMTALKMHLSGKFEATITPSIYCRFLTGMTMPLFSRLKIRQVKGFGSFEHCRYADVLKQVNANSCR
ncbi:MULTISPECIES: ATP-dependent DNA helicase RecQ [unclassified Alteromonas]|uniref:RecQ family ATP-dependent DNA helicase n=1 Tax=unclassified Alteromonas TaxID=2614992 RepID=UPI001EF16FC6|nr:MULTISPECIES: ATP-dependent DNA helicase RecQ [unclassified Alteromonas]MCG7638115.1 RecQ family ATP-dependent DNA helicase [Alteromonas sp. CNT1-28]MCG7813503.1 RecQ family ATP-dependent DNA helicase [Alteromonas sp. MCA-1]